MSVILPGQSWLIGTGCSDLGYKIPVVTAMLKAVRIKLLLWCGIKTTSEIASSQIEEVFEPVWNITANVPCKHLKGESPVSELKKPIPEIREREGNKKIHSRNSGKGIRGIHSWECPGTGIPAHPWCIETCYICLECILNLYCINFIENLYSRKVLLEKQNLPPIWLFLLVLRMATYSGETSLSWLHSDFIVMRLKKRKAVLMMTAIYILW